GRDLDEHAARLAEVNRLEVAAIAHLGDARAMADQIFAQCELFVLAADRQRDVVHRAEPVAGCPRQVVVCEVDDPAGSAARQPETDTAAHSLDDAESEQAGHQLDRLCRIADEAGDAVQAADSHVRVDAAAVPGAALVPSAGK